MILYIARHGETTWNREGRYQGQRESALTETGRQQAQALAHALRESSIEAVYASPLSRCRDSAQPLADARGIELRVDASLIEIAHGSWEGRLREEIARNDAARFTQWRLQPDLVAFPGGETLAAVHRRWQTFIAALPSADEVAIITHDVLVRLAILDASHRPFGRLWEPRVVNGGYARLEFGNKGLVVLDECVETHLAGILVDTSHQAL